MEHEIDFSALYLPATQLVHTEAILVEYLPATQLSQVVYNPDAAKE